MAFQASTSEILGSLEKAVFENLENGWVAEPPAARLALLIREEIARWTQSHYPGSTSEGGAIETDSRRRLSLMIYSAPVTHRVEIWGLACGDEQEHSLPESGHVSHSWVFLAHLGDSCDRLKRNASKLEEAGLKKMDERRTDRLSLSLWIGAVAPDGCPACLGKG